MKMLE